MLVLDTDIVTIIQRAEGPAYSRLVSRLPASDPLSVFISIVSFEEQTRGWLSLIAQSRTGPQQIKAYRRLHELLDDYSRRQVLDFDDDAYQQYQQLVQLKIRIGTMDLRIAAVALAHDATLISRNLVDFRKVPGLRVEDWTAENN